MGLKKQFQMVVAVAALGFVALAGIWVENEHHRILSERQQQAKNLIEVADGVILAHYQMVMNGQISQEEAQRRAIDALRHMRYHDGNYFWINDLSRPIMIMHPTRPDLDGQNISRLGPEGLADYGKFYRMVRENGAGFVSYTWPKPGKQTPVPKLAYVKKFEPWGWFIGTGIYIDDVDAAWRQDALQAGALVAVCVLVLLALSIGISRSIFPRLECIVNRMKATVEGRADLSNRIPTVRQRRSVLTGIFGSPDEVSVLISGFNEMLQEIAKRDDKLLRHSDSLEQEISCRTAELRAVNNALNRSHAETMLFLAAIPSIVIGIDTRGFITRWNLAAANTFGVNEYSVMGRSLADCGIRWLSRDFAIEFPRWKTMGTLFRLDDVAFEKDKKVRILGLQVRRVPWAHQKEEAGFVVTGADITERRGLEEQLRQAQRLEAVGQLAAGIAHEVNTPTQYAADNTTFLKDSCGPVMQLLRLCQTLRAQAGAGPVPGETLAQFDQLAERADLPYLAKEIPNAIEQSLDGLQRIAKIVKAMKEFSHPGSSEKIPIDINRTIETTITVARNEWKYVADVVTNFASTMPLVPCRQGEINQVILNLIVNAAQAIACVVGDGPEHKGRIAITTRHDEEFAEIAIRDTGPGIPSEIQSRIFEPFFTTKPVGKGTGQGLSLAHSTVVKGHQGRLWFETEVGRGTTFFIRLPLQVQKGATAGV